MLRILLLIGSIIIFNSCAVQSESPVSAEKTQLAQVESTPMPIEESQSLDGAYEFVSETLIITTPEQSTERRISDEWAGLWLLHNGHFSQTMMKKRRLNWISSFPSEPDELGFYSIAGTYKVIGNTLELKVSVSFYPQNTGRPMRLEYQSNEDILTLTETLYSTKESLSKGQRITVLQRTK